MKSSSGAKRCQMSGALLITPPEGSSRGEHVAVFSYIIFARLSCTREARAILPCSRDLIEVEGIVIGQEEFRPCVGGFAKSFAHVPLVFDRV